MFRCITPLLTARSRAEIAFFSASADSSDCDPSDIALVIERTRLLVNESVDRLRAALRFCARKVLAAGISFPWYFFLCDEDDTFQVLALNIRRFVDPEDIFDTRDRFQSREEPT